jgi:hypothetical protein
MNADQFRKQFWAVPPLTKMAVAESQVQHDGYCLLSHSGEVGPFVRGDDIWVADVNGRVSRGLVRSWSDSAAEVWMSVQYRESIVGEVGVALRFSPAARIVGAGQLIERFGGIPSLIYEQLSAFMFSGNDLLIRVGDVEYVLTNTERLKLFHDESLGPIEMLGVEFAVMGSRLGVEITSQGGLDALLLCDSVRGRCRSEVGGN